MGCQSCKGSKNNEEIQDIQNSIFLKIGGNQTIHDITEAKIDIFLKDDRINGFFKDIKDMDIYKGIIKNHLIELLGGGKRYRGKGIKFVHQDLNINDDQFDAFIEGLKKALEKVHVNQQFQEQIVEIHEKLRIQVVPNTLKAPQISIYEQLGGKTAIKKAVEIFYGKVLGDSSVSGFFKNTDMIVQRIQQEKFLTMAFGGPNEYEGKNMLDAHKGLNIKEEHFKTIVEHLVFTLSELGVGREIIAEIRVICDSVKADVCGGDQTSQKQSLYDRLGGKQAIDMAVKNFYDKVFSDEKVNPFFKNTDRGKQEQSQIEFLTTAFGGPAIYKGKDMYMAHKGMNIQEIHFDQIVTYLAATLKELGVKDDLIGEVAEIAASVKDDIVGKQEQDKKSLYDRLGGKQAIELAVTQFYDKVFQDPEVNPFFKNTDRAKQELSQIQFLTTAFGGPQIYNGKDMYTAHKGMQIKEKHFDTIVTYLASTLSELGVKDNLIGEVAEVAASVKSDIVEK